MLTMISPRNRSSDRSNDRWMSGARVAKADESNSSKKYRAVSTARGKMTSPLVSRTNLARSAPNGSRVVPKVRRARSGAVRENDFTAAGMVPQAPATGQRAAGARPQPSTLSPQTSEGSEEGHVDLLAGQDRAGHGQRVALQGEVLGQGVDVAQPALERTARVHGGAAAGVVGHVDHRRRGAGHPRRRG